MTDYRDDDTEETTSVECPFAKHQIRIARATLRMPRPMAAMLGGMTKDQARAILRGRKDGMR